MYPVPGPQQACHECFFLILRSNSDTVLSPVEAAMYLIPGISHFATSSPFHHSPYHLFWSSATPRHKLCPQTHTKAQHKKK